MSWEQGIVGRLILTHIAPEQPIGLSYAEYENGDREKPPSMVHQ